MWVFSELGRGSLVDDCLVGLMMGAQSVAA